jgi:type II secretory pathway component PulJ
MMNTISKRLLREEQGFTFAEVMVTMLVMITVLFALYSIFDMGLRVFSFGNDKVEAVENARIGLEKMEREIRAAYPYDKTDTDSTNDYLFPPGAFTSSSLTFGNELNGDYRIDSSTEQITYSLSGGSPATLLRNGEPLVEFVQDVDGGNALTFEYMNATGATVTSEADITMVRVKLEVAVDRGMQGGPVTQTLTTDVALKNREQ